MLFWKPQPKKKAEKPTAKRQIAPSAIELPKDIPHITISKPGYGLGRKPRTGFSRKYVYGVGSRQ